MDQVFGFKLKDKFEPSVPTGERRISLVQEAQQATVKAVLQVKKNVNKTKSLSIFLLAIIAGILCCGYLVYITKTEGYPPTLYSYQATWRVLVGSGTLVFVAFCGFFLLALKIRGVLLGMLYMFCIVLVIYLAGTGMSKSLYSLTSDNFERVLSESMENLKNPNDNDSALLFFHNLQQKHKCCGWGVDVLYSWAGDHFFDNNDLLDSCCIEMWKGCGKNASIDRPTFIPTMDYIPEKGDRQAIYGGRFVSFPSFYSLKPTKYIEHNSSDTITTIEKYAGLYGKVISKTDKTRLGLVQANIDTYPFNISEFTNYPEQLFLRALDARTSQLNNENRKQKLNEIQHAWLIYLDRDGYTHKSNSEVTKKMYYMTMGLPQFELFRTHMYLQKCESDALTYNIITGEYDDKLKDFRDLFIPTIEQRMLIVLGIGTGVVLFAVLCAGLYWVLFSRLKAEQLSNLCPPEDFEPLGLQLPVEDDDEFVMQSAESKAQYEKSKQDRMEEIKKQLLSNVDRRNLADSTLPARIKQAQKNDAKMAIYEKEREIDTKRKIRLGGNRKPQKQQAKAKATAKANFFEGIMKTIQNFGQAITGLFRKSPKSAPVRPAVKRKPGAGGRIKDAKKNPNPKQRRK